MTICKDCVHAIPPKLYSPIGIVHPKTWECEASEAGVDYVVGRTIRVSCQAKNNGECPDFLLRITPLPKPFRVPWWKRLFV